MSALAPALIPDGVPHVRLLLPTGACACVALQGAQVLSWQTADGREHLYTSPRAVWDGSAPIRGGVPVCWPQFNQRGDGLKHGFARWVPWRVVAQSQAGDEACLTLELTHADVPAHWLQWRAAGVGGADAGTELRPLAPYAFALALHVRLQPWQLTVTLDVRHTGVAGSAPMPFTAALHTYLAVPDVAQVQADGADGLTYWDAVAGAQPQYPVQHGAITLSGEVDRVYPRLGDALWRQGAQAWLRVQQSASMQHTVVWNPGAQLCASLPDMPADGWRHFACMEAAQIDTPVVLHAGQHWQGWQMLTVISQ